MPQDVFSGKIPGGPTVESGIRQLADQGESEMTTFAFFCRESL